MLFPHVILLVDDNPVQALTRKAILELAGFTARAVHSADAAFNALRGEGPDAPELVITDHIMPGESGAVFVGRLREMRSDMPILVLSGMADAEDEYANLDVTFRAKPIQPEELIALTRTMIGPPAALPLPRLAC